MTPRRSRGRRLVLVAVAAVALVLAACSEVKNNGQNSLEPKSPQAQKIYDLFVPILIIAIVVGIAIIVATVFVALKFRYKKGSNENPKQVHGNTRLEIGWTVVPALLLAIIAVPTVATIFDLAENPGPQALQVHVVGKQWWWEFKYPDAKVVTADELIIPTGRDVFVKLDACEGEGTSKTCNVIHSFWVPELSGKKDVVPGQTNTLTISADKPGTYLGQCAEYCGLSHANMRFRVIAKSPADFQTWLSEQQQGPVNPLTDADGKPAGPTQELLTDPKNFGCVNCHIFDDSSKASYGPNLTHLASRTTFASGAYPLTRQNLVNWVMDAPSMIPMSSQGCRLPVGEGICVGIPSFIHDTPTSPPGYKAMTQQQAEDIADFLLEQK
jgi:cytochrome c oxidase subunit 2